MTEKFTTTIRVTAKIIKNSHQIFVYVYTILDEKQTAIMKKLLR